MGVSRQLANIAEELEGQIDAELRTVAANHPSTAEQHGARALLDYLLAQVEALTGFHLAETSDTHANRLVWREC